MNLGQKSIQNKCNKLKDGVSYKIFIQIKIKKKLINYQKFDNFDASKFILLQIDY